MLAKLLKYDYKAIFKYWWIGAVSSLLLSIAGGTCISVLTEYDNLSPALMAPMVLFIILAFIAIIAFVILALIFVFARFYKNLFTDEGYLTFTLPVSRFELLNSKLISSVIVLSLSYLIFFAEILIFVGIPVVSTGAWKDISAELSAAFATVFEQLGAYLYIYVIEILAALILSLTFTTLLLFLCITFGAMISKKAKVLVAIGIYYGVNYIVSLAVQVFTMFGVDRIVGLVELIKPSNIMPVAALIVFGLIIVMAISCLLLYTLEYWLLDRKLNLN